MAGLGNRLWLEMEKMEVEKKGRLMECCKKMFCLQDVLQTPWGLEKDPWQMKVDAATSLSDIKWLNVLQQCAWEELKIDVYHRKVLLLLLWAEEQSPSFEWQHPLENRRRKKMNEQVKNSFFAVSSHHCIGDQKLQLVIFFVPDSSAKLFFSLWLWSGYDHLLGPSRERLTFLPNKVFPPDKNERYSDKEWGKPSSKFGSL